MRAHMLVTPHTQCSHVLQDRNIGVNRTANTEEVYRLDPEQHDHSYSCRIECLASVHSWVVDAVMNKAQ